MRGLNIAAVVALPLIAVAAFLLLHRESPVPTATAAPPPMPATLEGEPVARLQVGRHEFQVRKPDATQGWLDILTDGKLVKHIAGVNFTLNDFGEQPEGWTNGSDINGDSVPEVVVMEDTGGAHCCTSWRIFHAGQTVEQIYEVSNGHTDFFPFIDLTHDGKLALRVYDWTFAYWKTSFASSPAIVLVYSWQNGTYAFSPDLTRTAAPSADDLQKKAAELDWQESEPQANAPPQFWTDMLDLIGSGNAALLGSYVQTAWPAGRPGKSEFLTAFAQQLHQSSYWPQLNALNGGNLEAALPR
jgi:hypothetical protein